MKLSHGKPELDLKGEIDRHGSVHRAGNKNGSANVKIFRLRKTTYFERATKTTRAFLEALTAQ